MVEATRLGVVIDHRRPWSVGIGEGRRVGRTKHPARRLLFTRYLLVNGQGTD